MIWTIAAFELRKRRSMLSSYVYFTVFLATGILSMLAAGGAFSSVSVGAGSERIHANAPILVGTLILVMTNLGVLVSAAVFGQAVHQDYENNAGLVLFTFPISKGTYLAGRFLGALLFSLIIFSSLGLGEWLASHSPVLVNRELFGPTPITAYVVPYFTAVLPNLLFTGGIFFALATLTRRMMPVYVGAVLVAVGYQLAVNLLHDVENKNVAALLDPLGMVAQMTATRYWTVFEKNTRIVPLTGLLLWNRVIWSSVGLLALAFTWFRFELRVDGRSQGTERAATVEPTDAESAPLPALRPPPTIYGGLATVRVLFRLTWLGFLETVKNTYFGIFALAGAIMTIVIAPQIGKAYGTATYPVTGIVVKSFESVASLFVLIIVTFYAGEIAWRERDAHFDQISDALPVPTWTPYLAKLVALCLAPAVLLGVVILAGLGYQTALGYHHYELGLYLRWMYQVSFPGYLYLCVLALTVQSVVQNKYIGHFAMIAFYVFLLFQDKLGLERRLWKYGDLPTVVYSDMNGFGHFLRPLTFYELYWGGLALVLAVVGLLFWTRGTETSFRTRLGIARQRAKLPAVLSGALGLGLAGAAGGFIYYNNDVLHHYRSSHTLEEDRAEYEKTYKRFEDSPQPRITGVKVAFDVYPETETLHVHGTYTIENKTPDAIPTIYFELPSYQKFHELRVGTAQAPTSSDAKHGRYTFDLPVPMEPHDVLPVEFDLTFQNRGFSERGNRTDLAENGTFVNSFHLPHLGYSKDSELANDNERKKYGLAPKNRVPDLEDPKGLLRNYFTPDADWVTFDATVSTSEGQIGIAPGYLDREWAAPGRHFFHYTMDAPILDFFSVLSARYEVMKDTWNGVGLEIYYHPGHEYDLAEMMKGMKLALAYDSANFGPYQYRQARILEFPGYEAFAQSFPNTIPYSESVGFIAKVDRTKDDDVDFPLYVTAHEISHQWWGHQVVGGNVQGSTMLSETLAQYSALMVMKKEVGEKEMRRFLKYELDNYLSGRGFEQKKEMPLMRVENQPYIHYNKGSVVMYALQDYVGEENINRALRAFVTRWKQKGPPYPNARALVDELRSVTPPDLQYLIHDFFETITLYENRALSASARKLADGKYELTVKINAKKLQAGEQGEEKEVPMNDLISIGAVDDKKNPIAMERRRLPSGDSEVKLTVDTLPAKAGVDPLNELIDRHPDDNLVPVTLE